MMTLMVSEESLARDGTDRYKHTDTGSSVVCFSKSLIRTLGGGRKKKKKKKTTIPNRTESLSKRDPFRN